MLTTAACLLAVLGLASPAAAAPLPGENQPSPEVNASRQISALQQLKQSQTPAEAKLGSALLIEQRAMTNRATTAAVPMLQNGLEVTDGGAVAVDIRADVSDGLVAYLGKLGAQVRAVSTRYGSIRAEVPVAKLTTLAGRADVRRVEPADGAMTAHQLNPNTKPAPPESKEDKAARIARNTQEALENKAAPIVSSGDRAHGADTAREQYGVTGAGVKICALSDGVDSLATSQAAGELPAVDVLPGQAGGGDEGTAMLEIIHDVAPGARLGFATAFTSDASFADNIRTLRFDAGCDIVVDDIIYFKEAPFQDWIIAQAVSDVIADGGLYFSSAGNEGNTVDGTAAHWEGDYVNSGQVLGTFGGYAHDFDPSSAKQIFEPISDYSSAGVPVLLNWSDPLGRSNNDYDLYLLDRNGNVVSASQDNQTGTQDAYERVNTPFFGGVGLRLAIVKYSGADRYLSLSALRGRFEDNAGLKAFNTPGVTFGHSAVDGAFSTAAAPAKEAFPRDLEPGDPANPAGPYPNSYGADTQLERFSSDGPRRMFYAANGTAYTPGNVSATGGVVRQKPDLTAADGVRTSVDGFDPFYGTSAAAPHAAAIAGLVLSGNPGLDPAEVRAALVNTAVDIQAAGVDGRSGSGVVLADRVLAYTGASPQPVALAEAPKVTPTDGGQYLDPGETATVELPVTNVGDTTALSTSAVVTSSTPGVTVTPRSQSYGAIEKGATAVRSFTVAVPGTHEVGAPLQLDARITFAGGFSPTTASFAVPVGTPSDETHDFAYSGAAVAIPDYSPVGASVRIPISGFGRASKVTLSVDGQTCSTAPGATTVGLDHTYVGDLVGFLTAPDGRTATVLANSGGAGNNLCKVVFADAADQPFSSVPDSAAPFTGTWRPEEPFGPFAGSTADGDWTFFVQDVGPLDVGSLRAVSLHVNGYVPVGGN